MLNSVTFSFFSDPAGFWYPAGEIRNCPERDTFSTLKGVMKGEKEVRPGYQDLHGL